MNTIYELAEKIHGLLERAGSGVKTPPRLRGQAARLWISSTVMRHSASSHSGM